MENVRKPPTFPKLPLPKTLRKLKSFGVNFRRFTWDGSGSHGLSYSASSSERSGDSLQTGQNITNHTGNKLSIDTFINNLEFLPGSCDMSANFCSRKQRLQKYVVIYFNFKCFGAVCKGTHILGFVGGACLGLALPAQFKGLGQHLLVDTTQVRHVLLALLVTVHATR